MAVFFTVHVKSDAAFHAGFRAYVEEELFEHVEFVVGAHVSKDVYREIRNRMILNNISGHRRDRIRNPRALGHDEAPPKVTIRSLEELAENEAIRGNFWSGFVPRDIPRVLRESIATTAAAREMEVMMEE